MYSKIIKNATVLDGTGAKPYLADIAIEEDKIVLVGNLKKAKAWEIIDASNKWVAPGFVDIQNHSDVYWTIFDSPRLDSLLMQGITTALIGNCGASLAPLLSRDALLAVQKWHDLNGVNFNWLSFGEYLDELSKRNFGVNIASMVGYSTLRRGLIQDEIRALSADEVKILEKALQESLSAGAFGLSSGLSYAHEAIISENELMQLAGIVKENNALLSVHLRSEGSELSESVAEALDLAAKTGVNLKISHFKARNKSNWNLLPHAVEMIETAYQKNGSVHFDVYPYDFIWQVLYTYLPKWSYEGGRQVMLQHLKDQQQRAKIKAYMASRDVDYGSLLIAGTSAALNITGKTIGEIAERQGKDAQEMLLNIIENGGSEILIFEKNLDPKQVQQLLLHPLSMVATDGAGFSYTAKGNLVHARCFGSMPKFLGMVLQHDLMPIEQAIEKMTSIPAAKAGIKGRGTIEVDNYADLVIFDQTIDSKAGFSNPYQYPKGISHVLVNGRTVVQDGKVSGGLAGRVLRKS